jgi:hypothetical protein
MYSASNQQYRNVLIGFGSNIHLNVFKMSIRFYTSIINEIDSTWIRAKEGIAQRAGTVRIMYAFLQ